MILATLSTTGVIMYQRTAFDENALIHVVEMAL